MWKDDVPAERLNEVLFDAMLAKWLRARRHDTRHRSATVVRLLAVCNTGKRVIGEYRFNHSPYAA